MHAKEKDGFVLIAKASGGHDRREQGQYRIVGNGTKHSQSQIHAQNHKIFRNKLGATLLKTNYFRLNIIQMLFAVFHHLSCGFHRIPQTENSTKKGEKRKAFPA